MDDKYDVFISYSGHDANVVNEFVNQLEHEGFRLWIDRDGIQSGDAFKRVILQAIKNSDVVLFFSSRYSNQSSWTAKEIGVAVKYKKHIIPILLDGSNFNEEVEFDLINLDFINYQDVSMRGLMIDRLVKSLKAKIPNPIGQKLAEEARIKAEAAEHERMEQERRQNEEAEWRKREAAERKAQKEAGRKAAERERKAFQASNPPTTESGFTLSKLKDRLKNKKGLRIGLGIAAVAVVAIVVALVLRKPKQETVPINQLAELPVGNGSANSQDYVDLDLPSGTLWAICNLGANKPEDYGAYFAWGETHTKDIYNWENYKYVSGDYNRLTKYCNDFDLGDNGFIDGLKALQGIDDPATARGSGWHTPDRKQWKELLDNTTSKWVKRNGVVGRLFTAKNGQTLFLPAAGNRWDSELFNAGSVGFYWSRSLYIENSYRAWLLHFTSGACGIDDYGGRGDGFSVRPVFEKL